jgi:uncharacterized protein (UPF0218 family)
LKLPENLRNDFKVPLGKLIVDSQTSKENILKEITPDSFLITVGDATSEKLMNFGLIPSLQIIDGKEKRIKRKLPEISKSVTLLKCDNPPGEITSKCIDVIRQALNSTPPVRIEVNGEEDLLVIPVCIYAPEGSVVMYGQPNEGLVIVCINSEIRQKTKSLLDLMK